MYNIPHFEAVFIEMKVIFEPNTSIIVGIIYRHSNLSIKEFNSYIYLLVENMYIMYVY